MIIMELYKKVREFYYKHPGLTSLAITVGATVIGAVIGDYSLGRVTHIPAVEEPYRFFLFHRHVRPAHDEEFLNAVFGGMMGLITVGIPTLALYVSKFPTRVRENKVD